MSMNVVYLHPQQPRDWDLHRWRCLEPVAAINRSYQHQAAALSLQAFIQDTEESRRLCTRADVLVIQQDLIGPVLSTLHHWKARDKTIVVDIQLAPEDMKPGSPAYLNWQKSLLSSGLLEDNTTAPDLKTQFEWGLKLIHGATVPTPRLKKAWNHVKRVQLLPSLINTEGYANVSRDPQQGTTLGWIAPADHVEKPHRLPALQALSAVCSRRPRIKLAAVNLDQDSFDRLEIPDPQKVLIPRPQTEPWAQVLAQFDLAVLPLAQPRFDHHRRIRFLEFILMKIPWIASRSTVHEPLSAYGWEIPDQRDAWENTLTEIIRQLETNSIQNRQKGYLTGISQHIDDHLDSILACYRGMDPSSQTEETTQPFQIPEN
jgi:hypothetical protein